MSAIPRKLKLWFAGGLVVTAVAAVILAAGYGFLQTEPGRATAASLIENALGAPGRSEVRIKDLTGTLPQRIRAAGVSVSDEDGVWLEIDGLAIAWRPLALIIGRAEIDSITARAIRVLRRPKGSPQEERDLDSGLGLPISAQIERLAVERIRLEPSVIGAPATFRLNASLASRGDKTVYTALRLERIDGAKGRVRAEITYQTVERALVVDASAQEPEGGLVARLLDLPGLPAVSAVLRGDGPVSDWRGRLDAEAVGLASAKSALTISGKGPYTLKAVGTADVVRALHPRFRRLVAPAVSFDIAAGWTPDAEKLTLTRVRLASSAATIEAKGDVTTDSLAVVGEATVRIARPDLLRPLIAPFDLERVSASAVVEGSLKRPNVRASIKVGGLRGPSATVGEGDISVNVAPHAKAANALWTVDGNADLRKIAFEEQALSAMFGDKVSARFSGDVDAGKGTAQNARLDASGANGSIRVAGHADMVASQGAGKLSVAVRDLSPLSRLAAMQIAGSLDLDADIAFDPSGATARIKSRPKRLNSGDPVVAALLGPQPDLAGTLRVTSDGQLSVSDMAVRGAALTLDVPSLTSDGGRLDASYNGAVGNIVPVATALGIPAAGSLTAKGRVSGPIDGLSIKGTLDASALRWNTRALGSAKATYAMTSGESKLRGAISVSATTDAGKLDLGAKVAMLEPDAVQLTNLSLKGEGTEIGGRLVVPINGRAIEGRLNGRIQNLAPWSSVFEVPLKGAADVDLRLGRDAGQQVASLKFTGRNISYDREASIAALTGEASATIAKNEMRGKWRLTARDFRSALVALKTATVSGRGGMADTVATFSAKGDLSGPLDVTGEAHVQANGNQMRVTLRRLKGIAAGQPIELQQPAVYATAPGKIEVSLPQLSWARGTASVVGHMDRQSVSGRMKVRRLPAAAIAGFVPGFEASGHIDVAASLDGTSADPTGDLRLTISDLKMKGEGTENLAKLSGELTGKLRKGRLRLTANIAGLGDTALLGEAGLPVRIAADPISIALPSDGPIDGQVTWRGDIAAVAALLPLGEHKVSGGLIVSARATGTMGRPYIRGEAAWTNGGYENFDTGTVLRDIDLRAEADGNRIDLKRASANDGGKGRLTGKGSILLGGQTASKIDLGMDMKTLSVVRRDDVTAVASGSVRARGSVDRLTLSGRIETNQVDVTVIDTLPPGVVDLDVIEVNAPEAVGATSTKHRKTAAASPIALAVDVVMPRRVFVRGRGLDSEWTGELRVTGSTDAPVIKGQLKPVRGQFDLAGKVFKLKDGRVTFDGRERIDPVLNIPLEYKAKEITATVRIKGTASKPKISISSVPALPQDEILAQVLFNKETGQLTATEVVQVGAAVASLTGLDGGGLGLLEKVRQALGLDALRVGENGDGETTVGVGKYVSDGVFVGVDTGATQKSGNVTVEVTVAPNVTVKSDVGADARSRVGVNWKLDY